MMKKILSFALLFVLPLMANTTYYKSIDEGKSVIQMFDNKKPVEISSEFDGKKLQIALKNFPRNAKVEFLRLLPKEPTSNYDEDYRVELRWTTHYKKITHDIIQNADQWEKGTITETQQFAIKTKSVTKLSSKKGKTLFKKGNLRVVRLD